MSYQDIVNAINIDAAFSNEDRDTILGVIKEAYENSPIARDMFDTWVNTKGREIDFVFNAGDFSAWNGKVWLDMNELDHAHYLDRNGNAVKDTPFTAIIHELGHALTARLDNWTAAEPAGENQIFANGIYRQAGYVEQLAYMGYDASGTVIRDGFRYTDGNRIDSAWVHKWSDSPLNWDTTQGGEFTKPYRDLVIGSSDSNVLKTGSGADYLYGLAQNDTLYGGWGDDQLDGGRGRDLIAGGHGFDFAAYRDAGSAVAVFLATPGKNLGDARGDIFNSIEGIIGSAFGDTLMGNDSNNILQGRRGSDKLAGGGGNDRLVGGGGLDYALYEKAHSQYEIDLAADTIKGIGEGRDHLISIEVARFSDGTVDMKTGEFHADTTSASFASDYLL